MDSAKKSIIFKEIAERYKKQPGVLGIAVFGSFVRGSFDKYSDIDVYVLTKRKPPHSREGFFLKNIRIDVTFDGEKDARNFLKQERNSVRRIFSHMLANGKILYENKKNLSALRRLAIKNLKRKTKYTRDEITMHLYSIDDFYGEILRFAGAKDAFAFEQSVSLFINNAIESFLKIKGAYLRRPNELEKMIQKLDPALGRALQKVYRSRDFTNKVHYLSIVKKHIEALIRKPLPQKWAIR